MPVYTEMTGRRATGREAASVDREAYVEEILDHYQNPRNKRALPDADIHMEGGNPGCGDTVTLFLKTTPDGHVDQVTFLGKGCTISQAGTSMLTEMVKGKTLEEVQEMDFEDFINHMGREVVISRVRCATLGLGTLKAATDIVMKQRRFEASERAISN